MPDPISPGLDSSASRPAVMLCGVTKVYDTGVTALGPFDLTVATGEFVSLLGPSGCGKSTALRLIAGLAQPTTGRVELAPRAAAADMRHRIGFVFQEPTLMPWSSVRDNVGLPLKLAHVAAADAGPRIEAALAQVGLADFAAHFPR